MMALQFVITIRNVLSFYAVKNWLKKLPKGALCPACPKDQTKTNCFACRFLPGLIAKTHRKIYRIRRSANYCNVMLTVLTKKVVFRAFNFQSLVILLLGVFCSSLPPQCLTFLLIYICDKLQFRSHKTFLGPTGKKAEASLSDTYE